jgi:hypothetical protein
MFNITSKKDGTEPVVIALSRGIVTVGELAWAVKGRAAPERIRLLISKRLSQQQIPWQNHYVASG